MSFANFPEVPWAVSFRSVGFKQIRAGMYPAWAYVAAATILQIPVAAVEAAFFSIILYFMAHLQRDAGRFFFFYLVTFLVDMAVGSLFRLIAYAVPTVEAASAAPGPFVALQLAFAGFLIAPASMGTAVNGIGWMVFLFYTSVFAYGARSMAHNEFFSPSYNLFAAGPSAYMPVAVNMTSLGTTFMPLPATPGWFPGVNAFGQVSNTSVVGRTPGSMLIQEQGAPLARSKLYYPKSACAAVPALQCSTDSYGVYALGQLNISANPGWKWGGIGFIAFFALLMNRQAAKVSGGKAREASQTAVGSSRVPDELEREMSDMAVAVGPAAASVLPFTPMTVAWRDLKYTVDLPTDLGGGQRTLLMGINGLAAPGRLLALMGASGAGKTTLLDVLACRKTVGKTEGGIFLNGFPREPTSFARLTAYCEQMDVHTALATVRESLAFSAALRLPETVDAETRHAFVEEVASMLELRPLLGRLVGDVGESDSLAPGQRKAGSRPRRGGPCPWSFVQRPGPKPEPKPEPNPEPNPGRRCSPSPWSWSQTRPSSSWTSPPPAWTAAQHCWSCGWCARSARLGAP